MPFINGRFYANPIYGRAVERVRRARSGEVWSEDYPETGRNGWSEVEAGFSAAQTSPKGIHGRARRRHGSDDYDAATTQAGIANQIYNETASLRPTSESGRGSEMDLQNARLAMAHVIGNRAAVKMPGGLASDQLTPTEQAAASRFPSDAYDAFGASRYESKRADGHDLTRGAKFFYLDHGQPAPRISEGKTPVAEFGPLKNTVRKKGEDYAMETIKIYE